MGLLYERLLKPAFFRLDAERAHHAAAFALEGISHAAPLRAALARINRTGPRGVVRCLGLVFPNAVGLAAGFDKNARFWPAAAALGFGHVEIGTVTALAQPGNPRPRLFRYPREEALINRMGFNNDGAEKIAARLRRGPGPGRRPIPLGVNLGKSKAASLDAALEDYQKSFRSLAPLADYVVVNVSSPNTPDLRKLQEHARLSTLLRELESLNRDLARQEARARRPLLVKIAPDLTYREIDDVLSVVAEVGIDGIIATNTTLSRPGRLAEVNEAGGLSGAPVRHRSTQILSYLSKATQGRLPLIGVGGITDHASAAEKLDAGACLVQLYTGFVYRGPLFARDLARALAARR